MITMIQLGFELFRGSLLLGRVIKNDGAILTAHVGTLPIPRCRIVISPENFQ